MVPRSRSWTNPNSGFDCGRDHFSLDGGSGISWPGFGPERNGGAFRLAEQPGGSVGYLSSSVTFNMRGSNTGHDGVHGSYGFHCRSDAPDVAASAVCRPMGLHWGQLCRRLTWRAKRWQALGRIPGSEAAREAGAYEPIPFGALRHQCVKHFRRSSSGPRLVCSELPSCI